MQSLFKTNVNSKEAIQNYSAVSKNPAKVAQVNQKLLDFINSGPDQSAVQTNFKEMK